MATTISFVLNGRQVTVDVENRDPGAVGAARSLGLTGTKFGCGGRSAARAPST